MQIVPMPQSKTGSCVNKHSAPGGVLKAAGYTVHVMGYPFGIYCKKCADEIWKTWTEIIGVETTAGVVVKRKKSPTRKGTSAQKVAAWQLYGYR